MGKPAVIYFPVRALAEPIRLTLGAAGVDFENEVLDREALKQDLEVYCFGQCPRYRDDDVDLVQSAAILRYLGRKHGLYGAAGDILEATRIDQLLDGMSDMRAKIVPLVYMDSHSSDEIKAEHWATHLAPEGATGPCKGAHMLFIDNFVKKHGKDGFAVGGQLSIADTFLFHLVELHQTKYGAEFDEAYPALAAHYAKIAALPSMAAYLASPARLAR